MFHQIPLALEKFANAHSDVFIGQELKYILDNGAPSDRLYLITMGIFVFTIICIDTYRLSKEQKKDKKEDLNEIE